MPELPEVQTVINNLKPLVIGHTITKVDIFYPKMILNDSHEFINRLINLKFINIRRRGKYILFDLSNNESLISHLRMEGKYSVLENNADLPAHSHVVFWLENGSKIVYHDTRKFGRMHLVKTNQVADTKEIKKLGWEPFDPQFTPEVFLNLLHTRHGKIKVALLSQDLVVGLGNIYVDEVLYYAHIHPKSNPSHLTLSDATLLQEGIKTILKLAIKKGGTTIFSFKNANGEIGHFQNYLKVHSQNNKLCERDHAKIQKIKLNGRSTYFCPKCQILK